MPLNHYITLGRSGLRVSPLCLGTMTFGPDWGWGSSVEESGRILDAYCERGGNFIDTANIYTKGHSEKIIGDWLRERGGASRRDRLVIATKFFGNMYPGDPNGGGAHRKSMMAACEQSLRRLGSDHIDLYWMHSWDHFTPIAETMRGLDDLVRAGKVRYIGFSDTPAWKVAQAQTEAQFRGWAPLIALQIEYSLLERTVEAELIPAAMELGLGVTPWSPLKGGLLSGKYTRTSKPTEGRGAGRKEVSEQVLGLVDALQEVAREAGATVAQVALAWVQSRPGVASTIIGARTMKQLEDNLGAMEVRLGAEQVSRLEALTQPAMPFPHDFLRATTNNVQGGTTINGRPSGAWNLAPKTDAERY